MFILFFCDYVYLVLFNPNLLEGPNCPLVVVVVVGVVHMPLYIVAMPIMLCYCVLMQVATCGKLSKFSGAFSELHTPSVVTPLRRNTPMIINFVSLRFLADVFAMGIILWVRGNQ